MNQKKSHGKSNTVPKATAQTVSRTADNKLKVLIIDDHSIVRMGIRSLIDREEDLAVCGEGESVPHAIELFEKHKPELVTVDISIPGNGLELIKDLIVRNPKVLVLVLSMHDENIYAERALKAGAKGYLSKDLAGELLITALRKVLAGQVYLSESMTSRLLSRMAGGQPEVEESPIHDLSDRELQVFNLIGRGFPTRRIAQELNLSVKTVETYREHIKHKLALPDSSALMTMAIDWAQSQKSG
ncbi:MAG: response regulator transcription factor [Verrucomicrobiae bacterium]|nr:response regulator transcription factor [Verrucomicrobiae bacterium]